MSDQNDSYLALVTDDKEKEDTEILDYVAVRGDEAENCEESQPEFPQQLGTLDDATDSESEDNKSEGSQWETDEEEEEKEYDGAANMFRKLSAENRIAHRCIEDEALPPTVCLLKGENGEKVYLIGTAHFSKESCEDVRRVISQVQPDIVVVELCTGRTDILLNDEKSLLKIAGDVTFDKVLTQMKQKGPISGLMTFLLLHMSAHITKQLGMAPGGEFRAAYQESSKVPGCKLLFGDRAVEITLQRAFSTFSLWQKFRFALCVLKDLGPIKPEDIEKLKEKDMLEQALGEMMGEYPQMAEVFLSERDIFLTHSLRLAMSNKISTQAGPTPTVVVGVVGLGHVAGIKENFEREISIKEINNLVKIPPPSKFSYFIKKMFQLSLVACLAYGTYRFSVWTGIYHLLEQSKNISLPFLPK